MQTHTLGKKREGNGCDYGVAQYTKRLTLSGGIKPTVICDLFGRNNSVSRLTGQELITSITSHLQASYGDRVSRLIHFMPSDCNMDFADMTKQWIFPDTSLGFSNQIQTLSGLRMDGVIVNQFNHSSGEREGVACMLQTADCPTCIARFRSGKIAVFHAGRKSVITSCAGHLHGVVSGLAQWARLNDEDLVDVAVVLGIGAEYFTHPFNHPQYGESNRKMIKDIRNRYDKNGDESIFYPYGEAGDESGHINLPRIIGLQVRHCFPSISPQCIRNFTGGFLETYRSWDGSKTGGPLLWESSRRYSDNGQTEEAKTRRNVVLVTCPL